MKSTSPKEANRFAWFDIRYWAVLLLLAGLAGLAFYAYAGSFSRLWADDYCYSGVLKQYPFFQAQVIWWQTAGNRFSALPMVALSDLMGYYAPVYLPALQLAFLSLSAFIVLNTIKSGSRWLNAAAAVVFTYFLTFLAPDRLQTIYWRMGTLHYTLPISLLLLNVSLGLWAYRKHSGWKGFLLTLASTILAWFTAGLSESFATMQIGLFGLFLLVVLIYLPRGRWIGAGYRILLPLIGSVGAVLLIMLSPFTGFRQDVMQPPDSIFSTISLTLRYSLDYLQYSLRGQPLPNLVFMAAAAALAGLEFKNGLTWKRWLVFVGLVVAVVFILVMCVTVPSVYAGSYYPAGRTLMPARAALQVGLLIIGGLIGIQLRKLLKSHTRVWMLLSILMIILSSIYIVRSYSIPRQDQAAMIERAVRWDARHTQILDDIQNGQQDLTVKMTDVVKGLNDMEQDPRYWVNQCVANYYQVESITAKP